MKYSVKYDLAPSTGEQRPVRARVSYAGKRVDIRLGYSLPISCWRQDMQQAKADNAKNKTLCATINKALKDLSDKIDKLFARCELLEDRVPSTAEVKGILQAGECKSLDDVVALMLEENKGLEPSTISFYTGLLTQWHRLMGSCNNINEITLDAMLEFEAECTSHNIKNSTVQKYTMHIMAILRFAAKKKIYGGNALEYEFGLKLKDKTIVHLWPEELKTLMYADLKKKVWRRVRDMFCFQCYTGLRYSDAKKLHWADVHDGYIAVTTKKTVDELRIELNKYSKELLERARGLSSDVVFPDNSLARYNEILQEICKKLNFNEPITNTYYVGNTRYDETKPKYELVTSHVGRKTFVVNALTLGIPSDVVMRWTGHKKLESMKAYFKIVDEVRQNHMKKFDNL